MPQKPIAFSSQQIHDWVRAYKIPYAEIAQAACRTPGTIGQYMSAGSNRDIPLDVQEVIIDMIHQRAQLVTDMKERSKFFSRDGS